MSEAQVAWTINEHGPLQQVQANLWLVEGAVPRMALRRRMAVARMSTGELVVHSGIALEEELMAELDALGKVAYVLVPNGWHRLDAPFYRARYPEARFLCPAGARKRVEEKVAVDGRYEDFPDDEQVQLQPLAGVRKVEGVMLVRDSEQTTIVFNDALFNVQAGKGRGWWLVRLMGSAGGPKVTRIMRLFAVKDRAALRANFEELAATANLRRIVPGHGELIDSDPAGVLRKVAGTL